MTPKQNYYATVAQTVAKNFAKRQIEAHYCPDAKSAVEKALELMPQGSSIAWGGSMTLKETGLMAAIKEGDRYQIIDRDQAKTPEEKQAMYARICCSDFFLMSTNAFTLDGELVNVDGAGNRVGPLCFGPKNVVILAGMNKLVADVHEGIKRVHLVAAPINTVRLGAKTPCSVTGKCAKCLSPDCICVQTVITRYCRVPNRIKVIMIGEDFGY